jgi:uncharacterized protein with PQ loop repeat
MSHPHLVARHRKPDKHKSELDKIVYIAAFAAPLFELPQLITIYSQHSAKDVSVLTWGFFAAASSIWLIYALRHKIKPLIISYFLFAVIETITFIGIIIYNHPS